MLMSINATSRISSKSFILKRIMAQFGSDDGF